LNELDYIGIDAISLSDATTPSVLELNDAWQQHHKKIENFKRRRTKKYSLQSLATATQIRRQRTLDKAKHNYPAQVNAYESLFQTLTQKNGLREDLPGNGMPMIITNAKKIVLITPQEKPALETIKRWYR
jgi:hypothetical protein